MNTRIVHTKTVITNFLKGLEKIVIFLWLKIRELKIKVIRIIEKIVIHKTKRGKSTMKFEKIAPAARRLKNMKIFTISLIFSIVKVGVF